MKISKKINNTKGVFKLGHTFLNDSVSFVIVGFQGKNKIVGRHQDGATISVFSRKQVEEGSKKKIEKGWKYTDLPDITGKERISGSDGFFIRSSQLGDPGPIGDPGIPPYNTYSISLEEEPEDLEDLEFDDEDEELDHA